MKTRLLILALSALTITTVRAQSPTPLPMATPSAAHVTTATVNLPLAVFQAALTAVPSSPQSLAQLIGSVIALPAGADAAHFRAMVVSVPLNLSGQPTGIVRVTLSYATP